MVRLRSNGDPASKEGRFRPFQGYPLFARKPTLVLYQPSPFRLGEDTALNRTANLIRRLGRRLARQEGFALVMVIGISLVLGITGTTAMVYSTENVRAASTSRADERSFSLAEAGLNYAYATLYNAPDPTMPGAVPTRSEAVDDGTIMWWGTLDTQTNTWTLTGRGSIPSPSGGIDMIRVIRGRASIQHTSVGSANNAIWNYVYADSTTTCTTLANSVNVNVPFYVKGNLCLQNTAQISGVNTVLHVGGTLTLSNSSHVAFRGRAPRGSARRRWL